MACECLDQLSEQLHAYNAEFQCGLRIDWKTGKQLPDLPQITLYKLDPKKRGSLPVLFAAFCPFCGAAYEPDGFAPHETREPGADSG